MLEQESQESALLMAYISFMRDYQCLSEDTINIRQKFVEPFLLHLGNLGQLASLNVLAATTIHDYIIAVAQPLKRASKKHLSSSIRSFLRFAHIKGYLAKNLVEAVPVIATRKLDRLPQSISWSDAQKLLTMPDRNTAVGRRDYAVLQLLVSYGVRIGQVTTLKLQDIHWQEGIICFPTCKHSNPLHLPLNTSVAKALLEYIKKDRNELDFDEVFLTIRGDHRPLSEYNHYYTCLKKYYVAANIDVHSRGARSIRHAFASHLVEQKTPFKIIADLLGHRSIENTFIYTKVNVSQLRELTRPWPEVLP